MDKNEAAVARRLAAALKRLRVASGFSQERLAEEAEIASNYVSYIERAEKLPSIGALLRIATALGCDVVDLLGHPGERDDAAAEAARIVRAMPAALQRKAIGVLRALSA